MIQAIDYRKLLRGARQFSEFPGAALDRVGRCCYVCVVKKGDVVLQAGRPVDDLIVVARGRLVDPSGDASNRTEYGSGAAVQAHAFFSKGNAPKSLTALRDSQLLCLGYDDLVAVCMQDQSLLESFLNQLAYASASDYSAHQRPTRIALCPAGVGSTLDFALIDVLSAAFESFGEVRTLSTHSFGGGLPGAITLSSPETDHSLQEQDLAFDITLTIADPADMDFALTAVEEADDVIFLARGKRTGMNEIEMRAFETRGQRHCHLLCFADRTLPAGSAQGWEKGHQCRSVGSVWVGDNEAIARFVAQVMEGHSSKE